MKNTSGIVFTVLLVLIFFSNVFTQTPNWKMLGKRTIKPRTGSATINVGMDEGTVKAIKLTVGKADVFIKDLKVHCTNGDVLDVKIRKNLSAGGATQAINLPGGPRDIKEIVVWYNPGKLSDITSDLMLWAEIAIVDGSSDDGGTSTSPGGDGGTPGPGGPTGPSGSEEPDGGPPPSGTKIP